MPDQLRAFGYQALCWLMMRRLLGLMSGFFDRAKIWAAGLACALLTVAASAHDANLTLERLDSRRLSLVLVLDPIQSLHQWLAPQLSRQAFLTVYCNKPLPEFQAELRQALASVEAGIRLSGPDGADLTISGWNWPSAAQWQERLREQVLRMLSQATTREHDPVLELRTQAISKRTIGRVQLSLPVSLQPVLVIRPGIEQFWLNGLAPTAILDF